MAVGNNFKGVVNMFKKSVTIDRLIITNGKNLLSDIEDTLKSNKWKKVEDTKYVNKYNGIIVVINSIDEKVILDIYMKTYFGSVVSSNNKFFGFAYTFGIRKFIKDYIKTIIEINEEVEIDETVTTIQATAPYFGISLLILFAFIIAILIRYIL